MKNKNQVVENLKTTPIIQVACQKAGVSRATYYRWQKKDSNFRQATENALSEGINLVNDLAESQLISLIKEKHPTSVYYWLNHHHPDYSDHRLYLTPSEQKQLTESFNSTDDKGSLELLNSKVVQGKLAGPLLNSLQQFIDRIFRNREHQQDLKKIELLSKVKN